MLERGARSRSVPVPRFRKSFAQSKILPERPGIPVACHDTCKSLTDHAALLILNLFKKQLHFRSSDFEVKHITSSETLVYVQAMSELSPVDRSSPSGRLSRPPGEVQVQQTKYDNFYTPNNSEFYSKFRYKDLDPAKRNIRLLRMKPPNSEDDESGTIRCDLVDDISLLAMSGKYTTISYCAGDPTQTEAIIVNGFCFNAFANLGHALRQARHFWKDKFDNQECLLWVDQVCINQSNPSERSHQVDLMGDIYASAEQVLICLSTEHDTAGGIGWLHRLSRDLPMDYCRLSEDEEYDDDAQSKDFFHVNWHDEDFHLGWDAFIRQVLTSPWWSRAWVRQEFIRSPQAYFMAAFESIHWKTVADIIDIYYHGVYGFEKEPPDFHHRSGQSAELSDFCQACLLGNDSSRFWDAGRCADRLLQAKIGAESQPGRFEDLLQNLRDAHLCKASDPRDLIYAFLGFSDHGYGVYPDYSQDISLQDVLTQLARNVISQDNSLDILENAYLTRYKKIGPDVPSWVPDWRNVQSTQEGHFKK
jgi:hypothetical protein